MEIMNGRPKTRSKRGASFSFSLEYGRNNSIKMKLENTLDQIHGLVEHEKKNGNSWIEQLQTP